MKSSRLFTFSVVTPGAGDTFALPLESSGSYKFSVDWGDGNRDDITVYNDAAVTHTYTNAGTYEINIKGTIDGWRFNNGGNKTLIHDIKSWGPLRLGSSDSHFYGCTNLTVSATDILDLAGTTSLKRTFSNCTYLVTVPSMNSWNTSNIDDMSYMFSRAHAFNQNIGSWDVSNVKNMHDMFYYTSAFDQDIGPWDVSNVINMERMLGGADIFNQDIGPWNVSNVTNMEKILSGATIFNQDLSSWDVSNVIYMGGMFDNTSAFNQDIGSWNVSKVISMEVMFEFATAFNQDIGSWNVSNVKDMDGMFLGATAFDQDIGSWDISNVIYMGGMFLGVTISTANYDSLLTGWEALPVQSNVTFVGGNSKYSAGAPATARAALISDHSWIIYDDGPV